MPRKFDHVRLSSAEFSQELSKAHLEPVEFRRLTGASPNAVRSWLLPDDDPKAVEPPFWVSSWLHAYNESIDARDAMHEIADACLIREGSANG